MATVISDPQSLSVRAEAVYERLRPEIEVPENIGLMIAIEPTSGDSEIDRLGGAASRRLRVRHPTAEFYGIRIGYRVIESFAGLRNRREP